MSKLNGTELAEAFGRHVHSYGDESEDFVNKVLSDHNTLQQSMFRYVFKLIVRFARCEDRFTDARNARAHKVAKWMYEGYRQGQIEEMISHGNSRESTEASVDKYDIYLPLI